MPASATNSMREHLLSLFKADVDSASPPYHIGIARSDPVPSDEGITEATVGSLFNQEKFRHSLQSVKIMSNASYAIPVVTWESGQIYEPYDNNNPFQTNFYVINGEREVFLCLEQGRLDDGGVQEAFSEPTATIAKNQAKSFRTSDGYLWRYMYKISNFAAGSFQTRQYAPVKKITNRNTTIPEEVQQIRLQDSAIGGEILGVIIDSGGDNYTNPTITFTGNGAGARFVADIFDNRIVNVRCDSNGIGQFLHGAGYDYASITVTDPGGGSGASLRPVVAPRNGIGDDPVRALKSRELMLQTDFVGREEGTIVANNTEFYQVGIIKGLQPYGAFADSAFNGNTGQAAKVLTVTGVTGAWNEGDTFSNAEGTLTAKILYLDTQTLYYYQDVETGFERPQAENGVFAVGMALANEVGGTATITSIVDPDIDAYSGEILYINTLEDGITREANQTEDIRIVIQLG